MSARSETEWRFRDREEAGRRLAGALRGLDLVDPLVVGLPRGGVPVAREVADLLDVDFDLCLVRKLGAPDQPEFGIGAVGEAGALVLDRESIERLGLDQQAIGRIIERQREEIERQRRAFRPGLPPLPVRGRDVIVVDDGVATGVTARAAALVLARRGARTVVGAFPVGPPESIGNLTDGAFGRVVCLLTPDDFGGVGAWYRDFGQVSDEQVVESLAGRVAAGPGSRSGPPPR